MKPPRKNIISFISKYKTTGNAIDLGCGAGNDTIFLIKNNWNVLALVQKIGGEGTLTSISKGSLSYTWVDKAGQRLGATFNNESGKCTVASYR